MKKLLTMSALLLVALLLFTSCPSGPAQITWASSVEMNTNTNTVFGVGTLSYNSTNNKFVFNIDAGDVTGTTYVPSSGSFKSNFFTVTTDDTYLGFKATVDTTEDTYCGFVFNAKYQNAWSYYILFLHGNSYMLKKCISGTSSTVASWTTNAAINAAPEENEVIVYKEGSKIIIKINGTEVYTITNPQLQSGGCGPVCCINDDDVEHHTTVTTNWKFNAFQVR